jgi:hydroxymethylbilane synthase
MYTRETLRLGSRDSALALAQTNLVAQRLHRAWPDLALEVKTFKTQGDLNLETSLDQLGGKGLFVRELETALLDGKIDLAVHSMKDMPGDLPPGLTLTSVLEREDPRDVLISRDNNLRFSALPPGAVVGTSSLRRQAQLRRIRPDLRYEVIRGNLQTRYRKLYESSYHAIVLAAAGVHRLNWNSRITQVFDAWHETIPAVGQGILAAEFREEDEARIRRYLAPLVSTPVEIAARAERAALRTLQGGCSIPLGVHCRVSINSYQIKGILLTPDGDRLALAEDTLDGLHPEQAGERLAETLLNAGGREILDMLAALPLQV